MTNTPNPQANTVDEIVEELFDMGILTGIGKTNIDVSGAKRLATQAIQALITEAKAEVWQEVDELALGYKSYRMSDVAQDRLTQLKKDLSNE